MALLRRELARLLPTGGRLFATQTEVGIVSGLPPLEVGRKVVIYSPARTAGQQGVSQTAAGASAAGRQECCCSWEGGSEVATRPAAALVLATLFLHGRLRRTWLTPSLGPPRRALQAAALPGRSSTRTRPSGSTR